MYLCSLQGEEDIDTIIRAVNEKYGDLPAHTSKLSLDGVIFCFRERVGT